MRSRGVLFVGTCVLAAAILAIALFYKGHGSVRPPDDLLDELTSLSQKLPQCKTEVDRQRVLDVMNQKIQQSIQDGAVITGDQYIQYIGSPKAVEHPPRVIFGSGKLIESPDIYHYEGYSVVIDHGTVIGYLFAKR